VHICVIISYHSKKSNILITLELWLAVVPISPSLAKVIMMFRSSNDMSHRLGLNNDKKMTWFVIGVVIGDVIGDVGE